VSRGRAEPQGLPERQRRGGALAGGLEFGDRKAAEAEELFERDALRGCDRLVGVTLLDDVEDAGSVRDRDSSTRRHSTRLRVTPRSKKPLWPSARWKLQP
jgi:hypothetical protein